MKSGTTYIWGTAADATGHVHYSSVESEKMAGGGMRVWEHHEYDVEPASSYASVHPAPMPMKWHHGEDVGRIVSLRRSHQRLLAVAETELEPDELQLLSEEYGDLRWSTGTENRRRDKLRIVEISLTPSPATIGLPPVRWWKLDVVKGNLPQWVQEDLQRADKTEFRHRGELRVHDLDYERNPYSDPDRYENEIRLLQGGDSREGRHGYMNIDGERVPIEFYPGGPVIAVNGRPVRR